MDIQFTQILFQIINFSLLLFVFKKYLYKPILNILDSRAERIKQGLVAAEKNIKLTQDIESEKTKTLDEAKAQAQSIIEAAKKEQATLIKQAQAQAQVEAKKAIAKEKTAWQAQIKKSQDQMATQLSSGIVAGTEAVLKGLLDSKLQNQIIQTQIKKLDLKSLVS